MWKGKFWWEVGWDWECVSNGFVTSGMRRVLQ